VVYISVAQLDLTPIGFEIKSKKNNFSEDYFLGGVTCMTDVAQSITHETTFRVRIIFGSNWKISYWQC